jgi:hypothetical protein
VQKALDVILRRNVAVPEVPVCSEHHVDMRLRGKQGRPTRFSAQTEEEYTLIYYCPVDGCNQTDSRTRSETQIPVPGESPERPSYARRK